MRPVIRWLYLNFKYRVWPLPTDPASLQKIAMDLRVPLAFTYRMHGLDVAPDALQAAVLVIVLVMSLEET
jgi:hypothetical protein